MLASMRLLGIDYGTKRVGVALTDPAGAMAFPHATYANDRELVEKIIDLCKEKEVEGVVVGKSDNLDGTPNTVQKDIDAFVAVLQAELAIPVEYEPEQFSTQAALRIQGRTKETDASAAALILDTYLTRHQHPQNHPISYD